MHWWLVPVCTAISSWISFHIILYFLFQPIRPVRVATIIIQGYIPRHITGWTQELTEFAVKAVVADKRLLQYLTAPSTLQPMMPFIETHIDDFLRHKLGKAMPVVSMFVGEKTISQMKGVFMQELETLLPAVISRYAGESLQPEKLRPVIQHELNQMTQHSSFDEILQKIKPQMAILPWIAGTIGLIAGLLLVAVLFVVNIF